MQSVTLDNGIEIPMEGFSVFQIPKNARKSYKTPSAQVTA